MNWRVAALVLRASSDGPVKPGHHVGALGHVVCALGHDGWYPGRVGKEGPRMTLTTTPLWPATDLREATGGRFATEFAASGVSIDTRTILPGDLFIALVGETGDGHDHAHGAIDAGAAGVMLHRDLTPIARRLVVDDTLAGLTRLGAFARARFLGRVVAVTGSVGKTTTKEMLRIAL